MRLEGKRVINTRAEHQAAALDDLLRAEGAIPLNYPAIAIIPPPDTRPLDEAIRDMQAGAFDLLVLTSANAVDNVAKRAEELGISLEGMPTAAVGGTTAAAAREKLGAEIQLIPHEQNATALAYALNTRQGARILLPQAENAHSMLEEKFAQAGAEVTAVVAYQTIRGSGGVEAAQLLNTRQVDAIMFTSGAAVGFFVERVREEGDTRFDGVCAACLSERIGRAARDYGFSTVTAAEQQTLDGLLAALANYFTS